MGSAIPQRPVEYNVLLDAVRAHVNLRQISSPEIRVEQGILREPCEFRVN